MKVWMNGRIMDGDGAKLPVTDHGLLYGDGVFEGIRMRAGHVLWLHRHLARLERGARALGLEMPMTVDEIADVIRQTLRAHGQPESYARLLLTRGDGPLGVDPTRCPEPRVICIAAPISLFTDEQRAAGLSMMTASTRRPTPDVLDPSVKSLNYLGSVLAKAEARRAGVDEALVLNQRGVVAEAAVANVFAVLDGELVTPPVSDGCLPGITRAAVIHLASALGMEAREATLGRSDLLAATEVFLTGSGAGVIGVSRLDGCPIGAGESGPVTKRVTEALATFFVTDGERVLSGEMRPPLSLGAL